MLKTLEDLVTLARERKKNPVEGSYTNKLLEDETLSKEKVLEEIGELIESVEKNTNKIQMSLFCSRRSLSFPIQMNFLSKKRSAVH